MKRRGAGVNVTESVWDYAPRVGDVVNVGLRSGLSETGIRRREVCGKSVIGACEQGPVVVKR